MFASPFLVSKHDSSNSKSGSCWTRLDSVFISEKCPFLYGFNLMKVDEKRWLWGFGSLIFSRRVDTPLVLEICCEFRHRKFDTKKTKNGTIQVSRVLMLRSLILWKKKPSAFKNVAGARRGHGLTPITLPLPERPATSVPAGEEALTSVGSSLHASGQCLVWRGGWVSWFVVGCYKHETLHQWLPNKNIPFFFCILKRLHETSKLWAFHSL